MNARDLIKSGYVVAGLAGSELASLMFLMESLAHLRSRLRVMCFLTKTPRSHMQRLCLSPKHQPDFGSISDVRCLEVSLTSEIKGRYGDAMLEVLHAAWVSVERKFLRIFEVGKSVIKCN